MLCDYGLLDINLDPLREAVQAIPRVQWERRQDPESEKTWKIRDVRPVFPKVLIDAALEAVTCFGPGTTSRVVLSCVPAGEGILPHTDDFGETGTRSWHCHLPLTTHPDVVMGGPDGETHMHEGHVYTMDATKRHWVRNPSPVDRVHLLFAYFPLSLAS